MPDNKKQKQSVQDGNKQYDKTKHRKVNIIQFNLNRSKQAHDMLNKTIQEHNTDVVIISEHNIKISKKGVWNTDNKSDAAIKIYGQKIKIDGQEKANGYLWVETEHFTIYSCYI